MEENKSNIPQEELIQEIDEYEIAYFIVPLNIQPVMEMRTIEVKWVCKEDWVVPNLRADPDCFNEFRKMVPRFICNINASAILPENQKNWVLLFSLLRRFQNFDKNTKAVRITFAIQVQLKILQGVIFEIFGKNGSNI